MFLLILAMIAGIFGESVADCEIAVTSLSLSAATQDWTSADGRLCNSVFDFEFSFLMHDTLCNEDANNYCRADVDCVP